MVVYRRVTLKQSSHVWQQFTGLLNERELNGAQCIVIARQAFSEKGANGFDHCFRALDVLRLGEHVTRLFIDEQQRHGERGDIELGCKGHDVFESLQQRGQALICCSTLLVRAEMKHHVTESQVGMSRDEHVTWLQRLGVTLDLLQLLLDIIEVKFCGRVAQRQEF